jgi:hypothetical protein
MEIAFSVYYNNYQKTLSIAFIITTLTIIKKKKTLSIAFIITTLISNKKHCHNKICIYCIISHFSNYYP